MATERSRRRALTLGAIATVIVALLYITGGVVAGLKSAANAIVNPFSWSVNQIAHPIGHFLAGAINFNDVVAQNQKLRYELGRAELKANQTWALQRQLEQLTSELHVPFVGSLPTIAAQVTAVSPTNFAATVDISVGRDNGVLAGMPVVANGGLVGSVISTSPHGSTVRLITDVNSSIGATYANGKDTLLVTGSGVNNGLGATSVPLTTSISRGTIISTDGLQGGLYPPGLPVAKVTKVTLTPGAATYNLELQPTADLRTLHYLDVVIWEPST
ncbi:MAG: rod shape-determining protein MreC [Acidobacteria bacterium]|nr:rod shape-determining protein MreC [Acidobacteriota bacterium]